MSATRIEIWRGEEYEVRSVTGSAATKSYRCPGCQQLIRPATPHVVAWPVIPSLLTSFSGTGLDERRHWHTHCWKRR
ncbi:MAG TPA: hypothetical protein VFM09_09580 [Marmoricola sp.]|nr:hypothetical protein [Marmoricola sp.]